jgi:hypothetical protein
MASDLDQGEDDPPISHILSDLRERQRQDEAELHPLPPMIKRDHNNPRHQINTLDNVAYDLACYADDMENMFPDDDFQTTCTPEIRAERAQEMREAIDRILKVLKAITTK